MVLEERERLICSGRKFGYNAAQVVQAGKVADELKI
jgi:hypothetical protein